MADKEGLREKIAAEFVTALEADKIPWSKMWQSETAYNATTGKDYRGVNALWLSYQAGEKGYTDPRWCTFKQAADRGWHVKKGETSTQIEFWSLYDKKTKKNISYEEADKIIKEDKEREKDITYVSKRACVFNAAQIEGIPKLAERQSTVDIAVIRGQRDTLIQNMGVTFREGGDRAFYRPDEDSVTMPPDTAFESDYAYMSTLLHEAGHATGHPSRFDRDLSGQFGSEKYAKEELRAEIASAFTAQALGFGEQETGLHTSLENHKAYIQSWCRAITDAPQELFAAIRDAEKISDYLIEKGEFERVPKAPEVIEEKQHESLEGKVQDAEKEPGLQEPAHNRSRGISR